MFTNSSSCTDAKASGPGHPWKTLFHWIQLLHRDHRVISALLALQKIVIPIFFVFATQNTPKPSVFILTKYPLGTATDRCLCKYNLMAPHRDGPFSWRRGLKCYLHERSSQWSSFDRSPVIFSFLFYHCHHHCPPHLFPFHNLKFYLNLSIDFLIFEMGVLVRSQVFNTKFTLCFIVKNFIHTRTHYIWGICIYI